MSSTNALGAWYPELAVKKQSRIGRIAHWSARFIRSSALGAASAVFLLIVVLVALGADVLAPYDPFANNYAAMMAAPSALHWLGTDQLGRDVLSRLLLGTRISLLVAVSAVVIGDSIGFAIGLTAGYKGGRVDLISQRFIDVLQAFPALILALLLMAGMGAGMATVMVAIAVTRIPACARVVRSVTLSIKEMPYIEAARVQGATTWRIMLRHVAPQCIAPMLVVISVGLGTAIFTESALSYLGAGVPPPMPSLGNMLGEQVSQAFKPPWWVILYPGLSITAIILATNLVGDALRDVLDPRMKQRVARGD